MLEKVETFIYLWLHWFFDAVCRLSLVVVSGSPLQVCTGFSLWWLLVVLASPVEEQGSRACWLQQSWHTGAQLPRSGIEPLCPALAGMLLTALPQGKSCTCFLTELNFCPQLPGRGECLVLFISQAQYLMFLTQSEFQHILEGNRHRGIAHLFPIIHWESQSKFSNFPYTLRKSSI